MRWIKHEAVMVTADTKTPTGEPRNVLVRDREGRYFRTTEVEARAVLSGHGAPPLSRDYWSFSPNAAYRIVEERGVGT